MVPLHHEMTQETELESFLEFLRESINRDEMLGKVKFLILSDEMMSLLNFIHHKF